MTCTCICTVVDIMITLLVVDSNMIGGASNSEKESFQFIVSTKILCQEVISSS